MTLLEIFLKSKKVQKALSTKPGEEGFSLVELVVVIAVLAILSAVAIPAFNGVQANARASAVKNGLVNGVKECVILDADNKTIAPWNVVQSFKGTFNGYTLGQYSGKTDNCYSAYATADASKTAEANFWIEYKSDGTVDKGCEDAAFPGCNGTAGSAGTW